MSIFSSAMDDVCAGGICGYAEESFVMQNVALNPVINVMAQVGAVYGGCSVSEVEDNYAIDKMLINSQHISAGEGNCKIKSEKSLCDVNFYFKPLVQNGLLGWGNSTSGEDIWTASGSKYPFPVLTNVKRQDTLKKPTYK